MDYMHKDHSEDIAKIKEHLAAIVSTGTYSMKDLAHLGGAVMWMKYLEECQSANMHGQQVQTPYGHQ